MLAAKLKGTFRTIAIKNYIGIFDVGILYKFVIVKGNYETLQCAWRTHLIDPILWTSHSLSVLINLIKFLEVLFEVYVLDRRKEVK